MSISPIEASSAANPDLKPPVIVGVDPANLPDIGVDPADEIPAQEVPDEINVDRPVVGDDTVVDEEEKGFWEWIQEELDGIKGWLSSTVGGVKNDTNGQGK
jgi:hypothetical protein